MTRIPVRRTGFAVGVAVCASLALALTLAPAFARRVQSARADTVRRRAVAALGGHRSWRADIVQTETGSDGKRAVMRERLLVGRSGETRVTLAESDSKGRTVTSTTVRGRGRMVTRRVNADGSTMLHIYNGVRPTLGVEFDNLLGQTAKTVADAELLKVVGRDVRSGVDADKLQLGAGHYVWVARSTGLPVEEQVVSAGIVAHDLRFSNVAADVAAPDSAFDPGALGAADRTIAEDLGFREVASAATASTALGFVPLVFDAPAGYSADVQGYVDPDVPSGDAPSEAAFVTSLANGTERLLVTQVLREGIGDTVPNAADEGPEPARAVSIGGHPAIIDDDGARTQLVLARGDILVTIEGTMPESGMKAFAETIR